MPLFDFICTECKKIFEKLVRTDTRVECPACGASCEKQLSKPSSFDLKGNGWYKTDFKNN